MLPYRFDKDVLDYQKISEYYKPGKIYHFELILESIKEGAMVPEERMDDFLAIDASRDEITTKEELENCREFNRFSEELGQLQGLRATYTFRELIYMQRNQIQNSNGKDQLLRRVQMAL